MKAQRRHELRTNALAKSLESFPEKLARNANKILVVVLAIVLVFLLVRYRMNAAEENRQKVAGALANAQEQIPELENLASSPQDQRRLGQGILDSLDSVDSNSADQPAIAAAALVARGDANLAMATGALATATQPSSPQGLSPTDLLKAAEDAYSQVVSRFPDDMLDVVTAHFGLAAVAENRHDWDKARTEYQAISDLPNVPDVFKRQATQRRDKLTMLATPMYIGEPISISTTSTAPAILSPPIPTDLPPATAPATQPTTR